MTNVGSDSGNGESSGGLVLFGITFTSKILGILLGVGGIGLAAYAASTLVVPIWTEVQTGQQSLGTKKTTVSTLETQLASKGNIAQKIEEAKQQAKVVIDLLPDIDNIDTLIRDIQDQIPKTIVIALPPNFSYELAGTLRAFQPSEPVKGEQYDTYSFAIGFDGKFEDVLNTIQKIERLDALLVVKDLKLTKKALPTTKFTFSRPIAAGKEKEILDSLPPLIGADFTLQAFVPKSEADRDAAVKAATAASKAAAPPKK
jgi:type IV pilus assembly protein PilO